MKEQRAVGKMRLNLKGAWIVEHIRDGKVIGRYKLSNGIADVGMNYLLDTGFHAGSQISAWYIGLIDNAGYTAVAAGDTMGSHTGWVECTSYAEASRPQWTCGSPTARAITNGTTVDLNINATKTLKGVFIASNPTKSTNTGTLWSTALFAAPMLVNSGDVLKLTYTVTGS